MLRRLALVPILAVAFAATGCITSTTTVKVKPDGSGTLEQVMLMNTFVLKQLGSMAAKDSEGETKVTASSPFESEFSEEKLKERIAAMKGVRLVSRTPISQGGLEGMKVVMAFDDVNQIALNENVGASSAAAKETKISMAKNAAGASVLTIQFPDQPGGKGGDAKATPEKKTTPEELGMMQMFFKGFRVSMDIEVQGTLLKTSSPYVDGNKVTLLDLDMERIVENPAALQALEALSMGPDASVTETRAALARAGVKGLKINDPTVTIEFR